MSGAAVCVIGALNLDLVAQTDSLPAPGETVLATGFSRHPGGKGLNQAIAAAHAGASVRMIGRVGEDEPGAQLLQFLCEAGVDVGGVERDPTAPTGQALITVSHAGENCIVVVPGANMNLQPPGADAVAGVTVLLGQLETGLDAVASLFTAAPTGCVRVLNAAPALPQGAALFPLCDVLVLNETELAAYAGASVAPDDVFVVSALARTLLASAGQRVVVTLGAAGALVVDAEGSLHVPGRLAAVVDTVGAGDCFCGVLAASLSEGMSLPAAAARANIAAALAVTRRGSAEAMPTREEISAAQG